MVQNQFRREKGKGLTKQKALHDNVNSLNVPTSLVVYFFALVFLCTLCPCISVNRINTQSPCNFDTIQSFVTPYPTSIYYKSTKHILWQLS